MNTRIISFLLMVVCCCMIQSCDKDLPTQLTLDAYIFTALDEKGGTWKPVLLSTVEQVAIPEPESVNSVAYQAELAQLKSITAQLDAQQKAAIQYWGNNGLIRWNEIARELTSKYNLTPAPNPDGSYTLPDPANPSKYPNFPFSHPPYASRALAYWSAAQFDALVATWHYKFKYRRATPKQVDATILTYLPEQQLPSYPSDAAAVASVSQTILTAMFPLEKDFIAEKAAEHRLAMQWAGVNVESDIIAGDLLGRGVAAIFLNRASKDGMKAAQTPKPISDSLTLAAKARFGWFWENLEKPQRPVGITPFFGKVQPWCIPNVATVRPLPPPAPGSPAFEKDAAELRDIANNLTPEQRKIANFWSDGLGSYTPPGHWNRLASDFVVEYQLNPLRTARVFAYLNMAIMDAGISCWDAKYFYHYPRPSQAIPGFKTILGIPNFPSYTSGHSTFSAAAAAVLSHLFPEKQVQCEAWAKEASLSRIYAGIHYRFDTEVGLEQGKLVGSYTVGVAKNDGAE